MQRSAFRAIQAIFPIFAAATAIQAATTVTLPAPTTTTLSASSTTPSPTAVTAAECRTNLECCEVVQPPPTKFPPIIGLPPPIPPLMGPLIGLNTFTPVCCQTVFTGGILAEGCVPVIGE